jgi:hypothetical protein
MGKADDPELSKPGALLSLVLYLIFRNQYNIIEKLANSYNASWVP